MALPESGRMTSDMIRGEFGGGNPVYLSQFYRGGGRVPNTAANSKISTGGRIAHSMFYGARKEMSPDEAINDFLSNLTGFSRIGDRATEPYPVGWVGNYVWPFHKGGKPGTFDWTYNFNNLAHPPGDSTCTIVFATGGRGPGSPDIQSIRKHDGSYVGFTKAFSYATDDNWQTGEAYAVYYADCDRRDIATVVVRHYTWGWGAANMAQMTLMPTNKWKIVGLKVRVPHYGSYVGPHEVAFMAGAGYGGTNPTVNVSPALYASNHWYNVGHTAVIPANVPKSWTVNAPAIGSTSNNLYHALILKFIPDGQNPVNHSRLSGLVDNTINTRWSNLGEDLMILNNWLTPSGNSRGVYGHTWGVRTNEILDSEAIDMVSWSCSNPDLFMSAKSGAVYAFPKTDVIKIGDFPFTASFTVRTKIFGKTYSANVSGNVNVAYTSDG